MSAGDPQVVFGELMEEIKHNLANRPRDLQTRIGPSGIGEECDRKLTADLLEIPHPDEGPNWYAWVGTCMHAGLEDIFANSFMQKSQPEPRFLLEQRVTVGRIGDWDLAGNCDVFDTFSGGVIDWKSCSKTQLGKHKRKGFTRKHRAQFHCYGMGMANLGHQVNWVGGVFMPRDGLLSQSYLLSEPYNPQIAIDALDRANGLLALGTLLGADLAMAQLPPCDDELCRRCKPREVPTTLSGLLAAG